MATFQPTFESSLDFTKPMEFPADMSDHVDPSNLMSSYRPSDAEWLTKDPFEILPWDSFGVDQTFNPFTEDAGLVELEPRSYATSNHGSPAGYGGYTIKTEDALSDASPLSDPESEMWSPSHSNDNKSGSVSPVETIGVTNKPTTNTIIPLRKDSNASTSSTSTCSPSSPLASPKSSSSSKSSNNKSSRSVLSHDNDAAAVMKRKKAAHNAIEKRYRTNMNAKFLALGNAIPRSGVFTGTQLASNKGPRKHSLCQPTRDGRRHQEQQQQQQQQQQNKSEILTNALSYIHELQDENSRLKSELLVLKENLLPRGNMMWRR
ncbi:HLH DNA binding domain protein, putative [Talaromyces stipitatus ATCC 10500]|uniref:HLH DNA binding domain protein, putative n=1 Tax=Talaromyces stipitatus (strain ATCC 10500 / CBS 375.48 / QM 6759 / NRRL 1006) TaxID=441959 RepID=B8MD71_TALSN|nr:HLH DNA binding domain protein, putative [Talaromyces stipitatus ATCC 10500]EED17596.1 HLH DNA binding domain protein, putative [Talaromyces stipitatus ATCC 10500]